MSPRFGASNPRYIFEIKGLGIETRVVSFHAIEGISEPFEVNLTLAAPAATPLKFDKIARSEALLTIFSYESDINTRYFHGVINKLKYAGQQDGYCLYRVRVIPYLWFLNLSHNCRIFQKQTIEQICTDLFSEIGMQGMFNFLLNIPKNKEPKLYCVQYNESNFDFVSRILEDAGIFYFFEHSKNKHHAVFTDMIVHCDVIKGDDEIPLEHPDKDDPNQETVIAFNLSERFAPGKFSHSSYSYDNASQKLNVSKEDETQVLHEHYVHDGSYENEADGEIVANIRLEEARLFEQRAKGISSCARFTPGYKFSLDSDENSNFVDEYILLAVEHLGEQPQVLDVHGQRGIAPEYENGFLCVPSDTQIRPPRITPKPVIAGLQSAVVVGPKGEEIHTDDDGRVKVQFHWDRLGENDEKSSCWLRVAQTWGGGARGAQYIPRIGDEVLVDFLEGDPDRPIVTGSVYNSDNTPINSLKQSITQSGFKTKTHKGDGFHELRFDDANGKEEIFLHSQKDLNMNVNSRKGLTIGSDSGTVITGNCDKSVGGNHYTIVAGKQTKIAREITNGADEKITIVSGSSSIVILPGSIEINSPVVKVNCGGGAAMPAKLPVTGSTGKPSGGGGGKLAGSGSAPSSPPPPSNTSPPSTSPPPSTPPAQSPESQPSADATTPSDSSTMSEFKGETPSGGWAGAGSLAKDKWTLGSVPQSASGLGDFATSGTSQVLGKTGLSGAGDLVSSASSIRGNIQSDISQASSKISSTVNSATSLKDKAISEVKGKAMQELNNEKGQLLAKTGITDKQAGAVQELGNLFKTPKSDLF